MKIKYFILFCFFQLLHGAINAQSDSTRKQNADTAYVDPDNSSNRDLIDFIHHLYKKHDHPHAYTPVVKNLKYHLSLVPALGYTLQTGFAGIVSANIAYFTDVTSNAKISSINTSVTYSQYNQTIVPLIADIWTKDNKYNIISDNRFIEYPSSIYGLGGRIDPNKGHTIDFTGLKFHQTILRSVAKNIYAGIGFYYDKFWDIRVLDSSTRRINVLINRELGNSEIASGYTLRFLFDNRINQINSKNGWYFNTVFRDNRTFLGSDDNWQSLLVDTRKYISFSGRAKNTLAFWAMSWLSVKGTPPYLLLPSTGWDDQYNSGRGYIQGRFRGKNMYYFETEYRYKISRNGLLGGVLFGNLQHFSGELSDQYTHLLPGYGAGLRVKLNKHSGANLCLDYAFGQNGSNGFFVNLGEVF